MGTTMRRADGDAAPGMPEAGDGADAGAGPAPRDETARARAYLDLWERHLARAALRGAEPPGPPPRA